jgi:hypothetical protein
LSQERIRATKIIVCITTAAFNTTSVIGNLFVSEGEIAAYVTAIIYACTVPFFGYALGIILSIVVINYSIDTSLSLETEQRMKAKIAVIHKWLLFSGTSIVVGVTLVLTHFLVAMAPETYVNYLLGSLLCIFCCLCVYCLNQLSLEVVELTKMGIHARKRKPRFNLQTAKNALSAIIRDTVRVIRSEKGTEKLEENTENEIYSVAHPTKLKTSNVGRFSSDGATPKAPILENTNDGATPLAAIFENPSDETNHKSNQNPSCYTNDQTQPYLNHKDQQENPQIDT